MTVRVPNDTEVQIIRDNGMDPKQFGVSYRDDDCIRLLNYNTRDNVTIRRGDRKWEKA